MYVEKEELNAEACTFLALLCIMTWPMTGSNIFLILFELLGTLTLCILNQTQFSSPLVQLEHSESRPLAMQNPSTVHMESISGVVSG